MRVRILLALPGLFSICASPAVAAQNPDLRSQIETFVQTSTALKIPANVDRTCVVDRAVLGYPKAVRTVDGMMRFLPKPKEPKDRKAFDEGLGSVKIMLAAVGGIRPCTPKPAGKR